MIIPVNCSGKYNIVLERGALSRANDFFCLDRKVLVVTDSGVPTEYSEVIAAFCKEPIVVTIEMGEQSKNIESFLMLLKVLTQNGFKRSDCVVAVGGGVVGDLSGFVANCYMRGIDFYNVPTTLLSQLDSSIGGKTAIDFEGYKNIVGAFWQPKGVIIDPDVLKTLEPRQISNGMAEAVKMALTSDEALFEIFERGEQYEKIETVIERALLVKKNVVEQDEREGGLRRVLNFGHTIGHAIESVSGLNRLYHGECVALGMLPMCSKEVFKRLNNVLKILNLPNKLDISPSELLDAVCHDKKAQGDKITVVYVEKVGSFEFRSVEAKQLIGFIEGMSAYEK